RNFSSGGGSRGAKHKSGGKTHTERHFIDGIARCCRSGCGWPRPNTEGGGKTKTYEMRIPESDGRTRTTRVSYRLPENGRHVSVVTKPGGTFSTVRLGGSVAAPRWTSNRCEQKTVLISTERDPHL